MGKKDERNRLEGEIRLLKMKLEGSQEKEEYWRAQCMHREKYLVQLYDQIEALRKTSRAAWTTFSEKKKPSIWDDNDGT